MINQFSRTELLIGEAPIQKLQNSRVAVFGIGGVGGYVVEALARSGIGAIDLIDNDTVSLSNINRQLVATLQTIGKYKVDVAKEHIEDINPDVKVKTHKVFYTPENADLFNFLDYDYIVDAIDTVVGKIELVVNAKKCGTPIICSMGAGNKMHPEMFEIADISKTSVCPLAKVMRQELKKRRISKVKVVYSKELPIKHELSEEEKEKFKNEIKGKRHIPGSNAFVPSVAGLIIAGEVIRNLINYEK